MTGRSAVATLVIFTLGWGGWSFTQLMGNLLGDCLADHGCPTTKSYAISLTLWRFLAIELLAVVLFLIVRKR